MNSDKYVRMRKRKALRLSALFYLMRILPIIKSKIVLSAFEGDGGYGCNPKYIAEELHRAHPEYELVWLLHDPGKEFPEYVKPVKDNTWNMVYHLSTAKVWIDNYRKPYGTLKRKKQLYIQTWHATIGFKAVGLYRGDAFPEIARLVSEWDSSLIDYVITNSKYCEDVYPKKLLYTGPTIRTGSPRVDPLINNRGELRKRLRRILGINDSMKLVLFAPTFRGGNQKDKKQVTAEMPQIDFDLLIKSLEHKFSGEWRALLRLHPQLAAKMDEMPLIKKDDRLIDVSQMPDMSEVLGACDMVITDYSSCAFDAAFANIPVLLFADDVQEYKKSRGQFLWKREELPFDIAENNEELINNVEHFSLEEYANQVDKFMKRYEVTEDGCASKRVVDIIEKNVITKCQNNKNN